MAEVYGGRSLTLELSKPFPGNFIHDDGRGNAYVPHHIVTQRLIQIFGRPPRIEILREIYDGDKLTGVFMRLTVPGFEPVEEAGEADNPQSKTNGARAKDACSDAIKRCSMRLGLGLHLWAQEDYFLHDVLTRDQESESGGASNPTPKTEQATPTQEVGSAVPSDTQAEPKSPSRPELPGDSPQAPVEEAAPSLAVSSGTAKKKAKPAERGETASGPGVWGSTPKSPPKSASLGGDLRSVLVNAVAAGEIRNASVLSKSAKLCVTHNVMPPDGLGTIDDIPDAVLPDLVSELGLSQESMKV